MKHFLLLAGLLFAVSSVSALPSKPQSPYRHFNFSIFAGPSWTFDAGSNQQIQVNTGVANQYETHSNHAAGFYGGLGLSYTLGQISQKTPIAVTVGASLNTSLSGKFKGLERPLINLGPSYDTLDYSYRAQSIALFGEAQIAYVQYLFQPYVIVGAGVSWNKLTSFKEWPTDPSGSAAGAEETFPGHTQAKFAYEAGLGLQYVILQKAKRRFLVSLDYRFVNLGEASLGAISTMTKSRSIIQKLKTNVILLGLTYSV